MLIKSLRTSKDFVQDRSKNYPRRRDNFDTGRKEDGKITVDVQIIFNGSLQRHAMLFEVGGGIHV